MLSNTVSTGQRHIAPSKQCSFYFYQVSCNPSNSYTYHSESIAVPEPKPTSGSGDLSSTLGEEVCAPLWCKISVLLSLLNLSSAAKSW